MSSSSIQGDHVKSVCKPGTYECCAYLVAGGSGFECAKVMPDVAMQIEERLMAGTMRATGDNCSGPPDFSPPSEKHDYLKGIGPFI